MCVRGKEGVRAVFCSTARHLEAGSSYLERPGYLEAGSSYLERPGYLEASSSYLERSGYLEPRPGYLERPRCLEPPRVVMLSSYPEPAQDDSVRSG